MRQGSRPAFSAVIPCRDNTSAIHRPAPHGPWITTHVSRLQRAAVLVVAAVLSMAISSCSSGYSVSKVQVGSIIFTDIDGKPLKTPPGSLTASQGVYVTVTVNNDPQNLGVDWSVYCGSALAPGAPLPPGQTQDEACGVFTPGHTQGGPIPTYVTTGSGYVSLYVAPGTPPKNGIVTLYAISTTAPNKYSSVSLSVEGNPISVSLAPPPPGMLATGATAQLRAVLNNDAADAGVNWSVICGSNDCGSFKPAQTASGIATTYTAPAAVPAGGTVQVIATSVTDPTKAASATISIE